MLECVKDKFCAMGAWNCDTVINHIEVAGAAIKNQPAFTTSYRRGSVQCCYEACVHEDGGLGCLYPVACTRCTHFHFKMVVRLKRVANNLNKIVNN
jgi:hypothetical protein